MIRTSRRRFLAQAGILVGATALEPGSHAFDLSDTLQVRLAPIAAASISPAACGYWMTIRMVRSFSEPLSHVLQYTPTVHSGFDALGACHQS